VKQKVCKYRLSRARRIAENVFGILTSRFRVFERPIALLPDTVDLVIKASCALHSWLRTTSNTVYPPPRAVDTEYYNARNVIPGSWRNNGHVQGMQDTTFRLGSNNYSNDAASVRDSCADYFVDEGSVPWQLRIVIPIITLHQPTHYKPVCNCPCSVMLNKWCSRIEYSYDLCSRVIEGE
jgi:hypothetical protein